jgi:hypothetical protein
VANISFFEELKRRSVFRVIVVYLATAWLLLQVVATVAPMLELSAAFQKSILILLLVGFPIAIALAWALEKTPQGLRVDSGQTAGDPRKGRVFDRTVIAILALAVGYFLVDEFWLENRQDHREIGRSVAVLPFDNLSNDENNEPFTSGIHDDLLTHLSRIAALQTTSRTSVLKYRGSNKT